MLIEKQYNTLLDKHTCNNHITCIPKMNVDYSTVLYGIRHNLVLKFGYEKL